VRRRRHELRGPARLPRGRFGKLYLAYLRDPDGNKLCAPASAAAVSMEVVSENKSHGGRQLVVKHESRACRAT
jgi:hypothetical protein